MISYIVRVDESKIADIRAKFNVVWESSVLNIVFINSDLSIEEMLKTDGIIACEEEGIGTFYSGE